MLSGTNVTRMKKHILNHKRGLSRMEIGDEDEAGDEAGEDEEDEEDEENADEEGEESE